MYAISDASGQSSAGGSSSSHDYLIAMGSVRRQGQDRVVMVRYDDSGELLACLPAGKSVELFK